MRPYKIDWSRTSIPEQPVTAVEFTVNAVTGKATHVVAFIPPDESTHYRFSLIEEPTERSWEEIERSWRLISPTLEASNLAPVTNGEVRAALTEISKLKAFVQSMCKGSYDDGWGSSACHDGAGCGLNNCPSLHDRQKRSDVVEPPIVEKSSDSNADRRLHDAADISVLSAEALRNGVRMEIWSGTPPVSCSAAATGSLIAYGDKIAAAGGAEDLANSSTLMTIQKATLDVVQTWNGWTPAYFRLIWNQTCHIQGTASGVDERPQELGDLVITGLPLHAGQQVIITNLRVTLGRIELDCARAKEETHSLSKAVVANNGDGTVLWASGADIEAALEDISARLEDLGLDDAPHGISVWEGRFIYYSCGEYGTEQDFITEGDFRKPTDEEWEAIHTGRNPWKEVE